MKPWLWLPPRWAHDFAPYLLNVVGMFGSQNIPVWESFMWRGMVFKNRLGIAGGVDKNADCLPAWWSLGCGFVEVGTVTPRPQEPNDGVIIDRDLGSMALWNRMGFPSEGGKDVLANLQPLQPYRTPVFVNVGKNRTTPNEKAVEDYLDLVRLFSGSADAFVINISSPNTQGLRDLQNRDALEGLLKPVIEAGRAANTPVLVKLSPDMDDDAFTEAVETAFACGIDGFILTNTTLERSSQSPFPKEGGVSGAPLRRKSLHALERLHKILGSRREGLLVVSVGGVLTPDDVFERLKSGADLVQVYSALIFSGPGFFREVAKHVVKARRT